MNKLTKQLVGVGAILVALFNPFSVVLLADLLITLINLANKYLVIASAYIVIVGATLITVGALIAYNERQSKMYKTPKGKRSSRPTKDGVKSKLQLLED